MVRSQDQQAGYIPVRRRQKAEKGARKAVDFNITMIIHLRKRICNRNDWDNRIPFSLKGYKNEMEPMAAYTNPAEAFCTKYIHTSINKQKAPVYCCKWTPEGRRLISAAQNGALTLWNGKEFNFEHVEHAHNFPILAMEWSPDDMFLVTADDTGNLKYWQSSMTKVKEFQAHQDPIRDLTFAPTSKKFAACSDDRTITVWDLATCKLEQTLSGHGWDVKTVHWHPVKGLLVSGSKDNIVKLWDPRSGKQLSSIQAHNNTIKTVRWNPNGLWFVTGSKDQHVKAWDIRTLKSFKTFNGHRKDVNCIAWHPTEEEVLQADSILYWVVDQSEPQAEIHQAHDHSVRGLDWHPLGHLLASCSNDRTAKFWGRNLPGDDMKDEYNFNQLPEESQIEAIESLEQVRNSERTSYRRKERIQELVSQHQAAQGDGESDEDDVVIPGMGSAKTAKVDKKAAASLFSQALSSEIAQPVIGSGRSIHKANSQVQMGYQANAAPFSQFFDSRPRHNPNVGIGAVHRGDMDNRGGNMRGVHGGMKRKVRAGMPGVRSGMNNLGNNMGRNNMGNMGGNLERKHDAEMNLAIEVEELGTVGIVDRRSIQQQLFVDSISDPDRTDTEGMSRALFIPYLGYLHE
eukprot:CAMPEP_0114536526 /NCGR_PEP_ID=MMETSP0109-20121206/29061_1 /TAXON_ID=29199 /ORGANISM="Chlorarachnion reptans, Strain CCCM449" /LENGTH=626 /DNA_ID=CAMNT_0001720293 /DNA_START=44 /DNA_END=1923 /DNA_ORIENTATION=+